ncbi:MAG TPA: COX15/CtaA family protein [Acidimicrobiales bacterium]|nr:COX15/CtaA family protein [Acidimicrobiales bacterium]
MSSRLRVSPRLFRRLATMSVVALSLIIVTGAAVRLTGSGLGCPDWPSCYQHHLAAAWSFHPMVEFTNRLITIWVVVVVTATTAAALLRRPRRADLVWLAAGELVGVLGQAVLGGLTVLFQLAPELVMAHFALSVAVLADAIALHRRSGLASTPPRAMVGRHLIWSGRLLLVGLSVVILAGTATTGSGPHAGSPQATRLPFAFRSVAEFHATLAMLLVGFVVGIVVAAYQAGVPEEVRKRAGVLLVAVVAQGIIGYSQYFLRVPAGIVELHIIGVTLLWIVAQRFHLGLFHRPALDLAPRALLVSPGPPEAAVGAPPGVPVAPGGARPTGEALGPDPQP